MNIPKRHIQLDVNKEKAKLKGFCASNLDKRIGVVYGPKSLEDRYCIEHSPPNLLGFTALLESLEFLGFSTIHVDPTSSTFLKDVDASNWPLPSVVEAIRLNRLLIVSVANKAPCDGRRGGHLMSFEGLASTAQASRCASISMTPQSGGKPTTHRTLTASYAVSAEEL